MKNLLSIFFIGYIVILVGCASQPPLTDAQISSKYPTVEQLRTQLEQAINNDVLLHSPEYGEQAKSLYREAAKLAARDDAEAEVRAEEGLTELARANKIAARTKIELEGAIQARRRALDANAHSSFKQKFKEADEEFAEVAKLIEENDIAEARESRKRLAAIYSQLELDTLKGMTIEQAQLMLKAAKENKIDKYAPLTIAEAEEQLELAQKVLEANRSATAKAAEHASQAVWSINRATEITNILKEFKQAKMTEEEVILWYQEQLSKVVAAVESTPEFNLENRALIANLSQSVQASVQERERLNRELVETNQRLNRQMASLEQSYSGALAEKEQALKSIERSSSEERRRNAEIQAKFDRIQKMFGNAEAEVYRQGDDILIRAYGFSFPSGVSEIQSGNFPLLNKINQGIQMFPESKVIVSGHTDNVGSDVLNQKLSEQRAAKVAQFLVDVGGVSGGRVQSTGKGKTRPVASNETSEGRAANRRVEILIQNSSS